MNTDQSVPAVIPHDVRNKNEVHVNAYLEQTCRWAL